MINKKEEKIKILRLLYKGNGLSRKEINSHLQIRPTTLQEIISELIADNLLHEPGRNSKRTGAKSHKLYINHNYGNLLGLDLGSTCIKAVLTDFNGKILHEAKGEYSLLKDKDNIFDETFSLVKKIKRDKPKLWRKVIGIGVADPGPVNTAEGISLFAYNIKGWKNVPTSEIFNKKYNLPVTVITASHAKAFAEFFSIHSDLESLFVVDMGYGIGAALIKNGELFTGFTNTEMEFGHIQVNENGRSCTCGKRGCLEAEIGSHAIIDKFRQKIANGSHSILTFNNDVDQITLYDIYDSCLKNDTLTNSLIQEVSEYLAKGLAYIIQLINPEKIIIHGPITILEEKITGFIKHNLYKYSFPSIVEETEITCSDSNEFSAAVGACVAIRKKLLFL